VNLGTLTKNEKKVLSGICAHPQKTDSELSKHLQVKLSTLTSIKRRLTAEGYYRTLNFPLTNRLGCELLAVIYMQLNPIIPLKERMETTKRTIEVFDEIFLSIGEEEKGFSISLSQNYTNISRINEIRTETFGKLGLLEKEYPHEIIFPFETSHIHRFFDFSAFFQHLFNTQDHPTPSTTPKLFRNLSTVTLSPKEKKVYSALVAHPTATTQQLGQQVNLSRHTVARMKKNFFQDGLLQTLIIPNLKKLGIEILTFSHIRFNLNKTPSVQELAILNTPSTIFYVSRKFEAVLVSAYQTYQDYKEDEMNKIKYLKEHNLFSQPPFISTYMFEHMQVIKDFDFSPLVRKIIGTDL
jgi:DNA-binding MarR family transcriptional regulator